MIRPSPNNVNVFSAVIYTGASTAAAGAFFVAASIGDNEWVGRIGGAAWVFALSMVILMPTVAPVVRAWATGETVQFAAHDHDAMLREQAGMSDHGVHEAKEVAEMVKDPVCGMDVSPESAAGSSDYEGQTYYFCSVGCKQQFDAEPDKYATDVL